MSSQPRTGTIAAALERQRLEYRSERLGRAIDSLQERQRALRAAGSPLPAGLVAALRDFSDERAEVELRLARLKEGAGRLDQTPRRSGPPRACF